MIRDRSGSSTTSASTHPGQGYGESRTGDHGLDSARDGHRSLVQTTAGVVERQRHDTERLSHAGNAAGRGRRGWPFRERHPGSARVGPACVAVDNPNWRSAFLHRLRPIAVQSPGIDAWLLSKEDAALLLAELRRRADFREHSAPNLVFFNGQSQSICEPAAPRLRPFVSHAHAGQRLDGL